jgi:hypothetical protein
LARLALPVRAVIIQLWSLAVLDQLRLVRSRRRVFAGHDGARAMCAPAQQSCEADGSPRRSVCRVTPTSRRARRPGRGGRGRVGPQARPARPRDVPDRASRDAASRRTVLRWPSHGSAGLGCTGSCNATTARIRTSRSACNAASIASQTPYGVCSDGAAWADPVPRGRQAGTTATFELIFLRDPRGGAVSALAREARPIPTADLVTRLVTRTPRDGVVRCGTGETSPTRPCHP